MTKFVVGWWLVFFWFGVLVVFGENRRWMGQGREMWEAGIRSRGAGVYLCPLWPAWRDEGCLMFSGVGGWNRIGIILAGFADWASEEGRHFLLSRLRARW